MKGSHISGALFVNRFFVYNQTRVRNLFKEGKNRWQLNDQVERREIR